MQIDNSKNNKKIVWWRRDVKNPSFWCGRMKGKSKTTAKGGKTKDRIVPQKWRMRMEDGGKHEKERRMKGGRRWERAENEKR
jgi:hypothetical protein